MQRMEKLINYIYFCLDEFGSRRPLIAGSILGSNLDSVIHPSSEFKKLILEQLPKKSTQQKYMYGLMELNLR